MLHTNGSFYFMFHLGSAAEEYRHAHTRTHAQMQAHGLIGTHAHTGTPNRRMHHSD
uniref:Uncharacterized protein n=1 Tax=Anguilla anguilla TaxID=7936 RepID=A0A0E9PKV0_ANGAN